MSSLICIISYVVFPWLIINYSFIILINGNDHYDDSSSEDEDYKLFRVRKLDESKIACHVEHYETFSNFDTFPNNVHVRWFTMQVNPLETLPSTKILSNVTSEKGE